MTKLANKTKLVRGFSCNTISSCLVFIVNWQLVFILMNIGIPKIDNLGKASRKSQLEKLEAAKAA